MTEGLEGEGANRRTALRVHSRFAVRGVWVRPDVLGSTFGWTIGERAVVLRLPLKPDEFGPADEPEVPAVPAWVPTARTEGSGDAVSIQLFTVDVALQGGMSASQKQDVLAARDGGNEEPLREFARSTQRLWGEGHEVAEQAAHAWLAHARVASRQPWLGLGIEPPLQYGRSHIFDEHAGVRLMSYGPTQTATIRSGQLALSLEQLALIRDDLAAERDPPVAESLLADAHFLSQEADAVDTQRAVLTAASACEIKTKQAMRTKVDPAKAAMLDLILKRVSNLGQLLDAPLRAALGVSLKDADRDLYDRISRLATLRNEVVHRGQPVSQPEGWQLTVAASQLFSWLDAL